MLSAELWGLTTEGANRRLAVDADGRLLTDAGGVITMDVQGADFFTDPLRAGEGAGLWPREVVSDPELAATLVVVKVTDTGGATAPTAKWVRLVFNVDALAAEVDLLADIDNRQANVERIRIVGDGTVEQVYRFSPSAPCTSIYVDSDALTEAGEVEVEVQWGVG